MRIVPRRASTLAPRLRQHALKHAPLEAVIAEYFHALALVRELAASALDGEGLEVLRRRDGRRRDLDPGQSPGLNCKIVILRVVNCSCL